MSEATEKQREPASSDEELATSLYRTVAVIRATELRLRAHIAEHGFGGFWHPGIGQEGLQAGAVAALRARRLPLLRAPRPGLRAGQGHVARAIFWATSSAAPRAAPAARAAAPCTSSTRSSACSARAARSARASCSARARRSRPSCWATTASRRSSSATARPRAAPSTRRRSRRRCGSCRWSGSARTTAGRSRRPITDHSPDREHRRPRRRLRRARASSSTGRTRSPSIEATARGRRARARRRGADADRGEDAAHPRPLRGRPPALPRRPQQGWPRDPARPAGPAARARARRPTRTPLDEEARAEVDEAFDAALAAPAARPGVDHPEGRVERVSGASRRRELNYALGDQPGARRGDAPRRAGLDHGPGRRPDGRRVRRHARPLRRVRRRRACATPTINETFIVGGAAGAAMTGTIPVVELQFADFLFIAGDEIFHKLAKWRYMHGGKLTLPVVVRAADGRARRRRRRALAVPRGDGDAHARAQGGAAGDAGRRQGPAEDRDPRPQPGALLRAQGPLPGEGRGADATRTSSCPFGEAAVRGARDATSPWSPPG